MPQKIYDGGRPTVHKALTLTANTL